MVSRMNWKGSRAERELSIEAAESESDQYFDSLAVCCCHCLCCCFSVGYMNVALEQTEEYVDGQLKAKHGDAFIRGNNILYISTQKRKAKAVE
jgi:hypothetical protein